MAYTGKKTNAADEADFIINNAAKSQLDKLGVSQKNEFYNDFREKGDAAAAVNSKMPPETAESTGSQSV